MQKPESDKASPKPTPKPKLKPKPKPAIRAKDDSLGEVPPEIPSEKPSAQKFATADAVDSPFSYHESSSKEDELAQAIKRLEAEVEAIKVNSAGIQTAMDRKLKLYLRLIIGGMSLLGVFDIFK